MKNLDISPRTLVSALFLSVLFLPATAAANDAPAVVNDAPSAAAPEERSEYVAPSRWSMNFTPVLVIPKGEYRWGGGADPEVKYTRDLGGAYVSVGARLGAYYAKNLFGAMAMPTLRVMVPLGRFEPYLSVGAGYGCIPRLGYTDFATMARLGTVVRLSKKFAVGVEGTLQKIQGSDFSFPSIGSMISLDL